jgi:hypothetical protein
MIVLYLKESPLGLKYLGKCVNVDPHKYRGSGTVWRRHLKTHNISTTEIKTTILFETEDKQELKKMGIHYSTLWDVVKSKEFANLIPEQGDGGNTGGFKKGVKFTEEHKKKLSESRKKYKHSPETNKKRGESVSKSKKGKSLSEEHKLALKKPKDKEKNYSTCNICGKYTTKTVISRNHGKNKCNER